MRTFPIAALALVVGLTTVQAGVSAQEPVQWEPDRPLVTRAELNELLSQYETVANGAEWPDDIRQQSRVYAQRIRERLERGDFQVGDRIVNLSVRPLPPDVVLPDTVPVGSGATIELPTIGEISLRGVLRSELEEHLTRELSRYIVDPQVTVQPTIRLLITGSVGQPGFWVFQGDMLLSEVIMAAGGPGQAADLEDVRVRRGDFVLFNGEESREALARGRSLDQLNLQSGDELIVPADTPSALRGQFIRWGLIVGSSILLGRRFFF